jgi:hypothetical protein
MLCKAKFTVCSGFHKNIEQNIEFFVFQTGFNFEFLLGIFDQLAADSYSCSLECGHKKLCFVVVVTN